jgi:hypothetical protein
MQVKPIGIRVWTLWRVPNVAVARSYAVLSSTTTAVTYGNQPSQCGINAGG